MSGRNDAQTHAAFLSMFTLLLVVNGTATVLNVVNGSYVAFASLAAFAVCLFMMRLSWRALENL